MPGRSLNRYRINLRRAVPEEAALMRMADSGAMPAAVFLRGAALLGQTLLSLGIRPLDDGTLLVPTTAGVRLSVSPETILETLQRALLGAPMPAQLGSAEEPAATAESVVTEAANESTTPSMQPAATGSPVPAGSQQGLAAAHDPAPLPPTPPGVTPTGATNTAGPSAELENPGDADLARLHSEMTKSLSVS